MLRKANGRHGELTPWLALLVYGPDRGLLCSYTGLTVDPSSFYSRKWHRSERPKIVMASLLIPEL